MKTALWTGAAFAAALIAASGDLHAQERQRKDRGSNESDQGSSNNRERSRRENPPNINPGGVTPKTVNPGTVSPRTVNPRTVTPPNLNQGNVNAPNPNSGRVYNRNPGRLNTVPSNPTGPANPNNRIERSPSKVNKPIPDKVKNPAPPKPSPAPGTVGSGDPGRSRDRREPGRNDRDRDRDRSDRDRHRDWDSWTKNGWNKDNWNYAYNSQHRYHHHGYWYGGIWYPPLYIVERRPVVYLQPQQPIILGQKWLGVTYQPYDGGGAFVTGIYEGSPAQEVGLEPGDVIIAIDGMDATNLPAAVQASDGDITLQVLRGRTGETAQAHVNIIR